MKKIPTKNFVKKLKKVKPEFWLVLILIFALSIRLYFFVGIGFNDDSYYLEFASHMYKDEKFVPPSSVSWGTRIGVYYPVVLFWKLFGINELSTSMYFILSSLGSIVVIYFMGKELFDPSAGLIAAFLLSIFPMNIVYASQVGPDIPFQFFSATTILLLIKSEKYQRYIYPFLSGLFLGLAYLVKSTAVLLLPIFLFLILIFFLSSGSKFRKHFTKRRIFTYFLIFLGFSLVFSVYVLHLYTLSGQWFYGEKVRSYSFTHDKNSNSDFMWYPNVMFNHQESYFKWIHDVPMFGFFYYFVVLASAYLLYERDLNSIFLFLWFIFLFSFFEYGLQFYCTKIMSYCLYSRHPRFLTIFTIPSVLLISRFLTYNNERWRKYLLVTSILFLVFTSLYYTYQSHTFLRNGMGTLRESAYFLEKMPLKTIYIPDGWDISKLKFYFRYNETYIQNLKIYECGFINCSDPYYNNGSFIHDSYVITWLDPYTWINRHQYPDFMKNPPENWKLLKEINLKNYGIFAKYKTRVYYVK
ncbi:MAG: glycosyltransferase family 39 protein [Candidatus Aenigmarchaeota archaeon]|nr:glycosyltransferase family 39 protein [Candidatus Aenigmarchaeota archaeon]